MTGVKWSDQLPGSWDDVGPRPPVRPGPEVVLEQLGRGVTVREREEPGGYLYTEEDVVDVLD